MDSSWQLPDLGNWSVLCHNGSCNLLAGIAIVYMCYHSSMLAQLDPGLCSPSRLSFSILLCCSSCQLSRFVLLIMQSCC
jgi:hypothetical protein